MGRSRINEAAKELGISRRQMYALLERWRRGGGLVSDLLPTRSSGGRGQTHLQEAVEAIVSDAIRKGFLTRQRRTVAAVYRDVVRACRRQGLPVPSRTTLERRIARLDAVETATRREGANASRPAHCVLDVRDVLGEACFIALRDRALRADAVLLFLEGVEAGRVRLVRVKKVKPLAFEPLRGGGVTSDRGELGAAIEPTRPASGQGSR
ncbi:helix-turn-helix domain-containing protein [Rathayibacter oskolensis]|uniref:helix-turn-helix domain-containing protein n=1 Tax=Rathayibacter oskolensis TaxID=1891671 RepID=UPI003CC7D491